MMGFIYDTTNRYCQTVRLLILLSLEGPEGSNSVNFFQRSPFSVIVLVLLSFFDSNDLYECGGAFLDF